MAFIFGRLFCREDRDGQPLRVALGRLTFPPGDGPLLSALRTFPPHAGESPYTGEAEFIALGDSPPLDFFLKAWYTVHISSKAGLVR